MEVNRLVFDHAVRIRADHPSDEGAILIRTNGAVLDLKGGELIGGKDQAPSDTLTGRGIVVRGARDVTIRGAVIRGFKVAIYAEDAPGLTIEGCDVSGNYRQRLKSTPRGEHEDDWLYGHENDQNEWLRYGAGIYLLRCPGADVENCRARDGQNGICLSRSDEATIAGNDMSFMSGWGLAMWRSSRCKVLGNRFDYCVRGYSHGVYARGQDSAGILVYEQCSDNVFAWNRATHGGDGFFLYAGNQTVQRTGEGGCNRNLVYENDFSFAVANGIEATFSQGNVFASNRLTECEHGIWAGYSAESLIENNRIERSANGISIEHGRGNRLYWNDFDQCGRAVRLWWDDDKELLASAFGRKTGGASASEVVERNTFNACDIAIDASRTEGLSVYGNRFESCGVCLAIVGEAAAQPLWCIGNVFLDGSVENRTSTELVSSRNHAAERVKFVGPWARQKAAASEQEAWMAVHHERDEAPGKPFPWIRIEETRIPAAAEGPPARPTTAPRGPLPGLTDGKQHIRVDEWGPVRHESR